MKNITCIFTVILVIFSYRLAGQCSGVSCGPNLILNPSFELTTPDCGVSGRNILHTDRSPISNWYGLSCSTCANNGSTPDNYNSTCAGTNSTSNCGDGNGSVGIFTTLARESVQAKLTSPLKAGHLYCFSMKVKSDGFTQSDGIGAWLHNKGKLDVDSDNNGDQYLGAGTKINANPQVQNTPGNMIGSACKTVSGTFCAQGGESWIVLSNFKKDTDTKVSGSGFLDAGYLIVDELSLTEINCLTISSITSGADSVCPGSCTTLAVNPAGGNGSYTYIWLPGGEKTKSINACPATSPATYKCIVTSSQGCSAPITTADSVTVYYKTFVQAPVVKASSTSICIGASTFFYIDGSSPSYTYDWTHNSNKIGTNDTIFIKNAILSDGGVYKVTATGFGCTGAATDLKLTVNDLPKIDTKNIVSDSTNCGQKTGSLTGILVTGVPTLKYSWDGGPQTTASPDLKGAGIGTHTLTVTDGNGCVQTATGNVWTKETPDSVTVKATSAVICEGLKTVLYTNPSDPSITYTWMTPSQKTVFNDSVILDKVKLSDAGTYTVTATKNNCISPEVYSKLTVDPAALHENAVVTNNRICEGDTVTIDAAQYIPGVSYVIYTQANGGIPLGVAPLKVFPTQTTIYYMEAKSAKGCSQLTERDTVTVYVNKAPIVPLPIASDMTICEGKTTIINVQSPVPGITYNVYDALTGGKLLGKTPLTVTLIQTTTLYIEALSTQGCKQVKGRLPITVKVNPTPQGPKITVENTTGNYICDGLSAKLISSIKSVIVWSTGETTTSIIVKKAGTYWVYYTDANGCVSLKDSINITIKTPPKVDASNFVVDTVRCNATIGGIHGITISSGTTPYTYKWFETTDPTKILSTDLVLQGVPSGKYTLIVTDKNGCEDRLSNVYIPSKGGIVAHLTGTPLAGYEPLNIDLTTNTSGVGKPIDYVWVLDGHVLGTTDSKTNTFLVKNLKFGEHVMAVTVRDTNGCKSVDYLKIFVDIPVIFHDVNIFTPNNDGHNDILIFPQQGVQSINVKIFDRWGLKLYEWSDPDKGWDGRTESGGEVPEGTYYYVIEYVDFYNNSHRKAGYVQLMR